MELLLAAYEVIRAWAEKIPGFPELPLQDQDALINFSFFHVLSLRLAYK